MPEVKDDCCTQEMQSNLLLTYVVDLGAVHSSSEKRFATTSQIPRDTPVKSPDEAAMQHLTG